MTSLRPLTSVTAAAPFGDDRRLPKERCPKCHHQPTKWNETHHNPNDCATIAFGNFLKKITLKQPMDERTYETTNT